MRYRSFYYAVGYRGPQMQIQVMPCKWAFGGGFGERSISLAIGPFAIRLWFAMGDFEIDGRKR